MNSKNLYTQRMKQHLIWCRDYLISIIRNSSIIIVIGFLMYVYMVSVDWLERVVPDGTIPIVFFAAILALFLSINYIRTLLKKEDLIFLLPREGKLSSYFKSSYLYGSVFNLFESLILMLLFYPFFIEKIGGLSFFIFVILTVIGLKQLNLLYLYLRKNDSYLMILQYMYNFLAIIILLHNPLIFLVLFGVSCYMLIKYTDFYIPSHMWIRCIENENKRRSILDSFANYFTDVPSLQNRVYKRRYITKALKLIQVFEQHPYYYLYIRSIIRRGDFFNIYICLTVVIYVVVSIIHHFYFGLFIFLVGLYVTGIQLLQYLRFRNFPLILETLPLQDADLSKGISLVTFVFLGGQALFLLIITPFSVLSPVDLLLMMGGGLLFCGLFSFWYIPRKLKKDNNR